MSAGVTPVRRLTAAMTASASGDGGCGGVGGGERRERLLDGLGCGVAADERDVGEDAVEAALELAHGLAAALGDRFERGLRELRGVLPRFRAEDGETRREGRRAEIGGEAPLEPRAEGVAEAGHLRGHAVAADDDLLTGGVEVVEGVEELVLELLFAFEELDVVDEQHVGGAIALAELLDLAGERADVVVAEALGGGVDDGAALRVGGVADGAEQVRLAEAGGADDGERIRDAGRVDGAAGGVVRHAVLVADDEGIECEGGVERGRRRAVRRRNSGTAPAAAAGSSAASERGRRRVVRADDLERDLDGVAEDAGEGLEDEGAQLACAATR